MNTNRNTVIHWLSVIAALSVRGAVWIMIHDYEQTQGVESPLLYSIVIAGMVYTLLVLAYLTRHDSEQVYDDITGFITWDTCLLAGIVVPLIMWFAVWPMDDDGDHS